MNEINSYADRGNISDFKGYNGKEFYMFINEHFYWRRFEPEMNILSIIYTETVEYWKDNRFVEIFAYKENNEIQLHVFVFYYSFEEGCTFRPVDRDVYDWALEQTEVQDKIDYVYENYDNVIFRYDERLKRDYDC